MSILLWIILGALAGWIAGAITGSERGLAGNIVVGIIGAFLGGWIFNQFGGYGITGFNFASLLVAVVGAIVLILILRLIVRG